MICLDGLAIVSQPEDFVGWVGDKVTFSVTARGENLTYLWEVSTNGGTSWGSSNSGGVATSSIYLYMSETNPGNMYRCKITDGEGNVVYSEPAKVVLGSETWTYTYDADGMRTARTNGSHTYTYVYNGGNLSRMTIDGDRFYFTYDASGAPMSISYNSVRYCYVTNIQGDVIAMADSTGTTVVEYTYDAWGNILTTTGTMAETLGEANPLRYRGYVYDNETGLYYLQSRYYDSNIGRFISSDALVSTGQGLLGNNMFAYCRNNPVCRIDIAGYTDEKVIDDGTVDIAPDEKELGHGGGAGSGSSGSNPNNSFDPHQAMLDGTFHPYDNTPLPRQGLVEGDPSAPPVNAAKQGKHVVGHNNHQKGKSSWPKGKTGVSQTQEAWMNGVKDPKKPDQDVRIGISSDGTIVRVHMDGSGAIHGYPLELGTWRITFS